VLRQATAADPGLVAAGGPQPRAAAGSRDLDAAEQALRDVLDLNAGNSEARNNLAVLLRRRQWRAAD
jgi:Flp pilus assembly protein TadD